LIPKEGCYLREMLLNDLAQVLDWRNSERVSKYMLTDQVITMEEHQNWFVNLKNETKSKHLIFEYQGVSSGVVNFTNIDYRNHKCNWGFYLGNEYLPSGTGTIMGSLAIQYAFEVLNIRKLCAEVLVFNEGSISLHLKLGFVEEGRHIKHVLNKGVYVDVLCFGFINEQFIYRSGDE
jgi:UDP-4-amino-4,6-dideoxy-N-acetyl-beta-L-altrosamine N-acetyltransferase